MRLTCIDFFSICDSAPVPFAGSKGTKRAFCTLVLSGTVLRVPDAENLKIRPEFLPNDLFRIYLECVKPNVVIPEAQKELSGIFD